MRSGLWAIACVIATHSDIALSREGFGTAILITAVMLIMDVAEFITRAGRK